MGIRTIIQVTNDDIEWARGAVARGQHHFPQLSPFGLIPYDRKTKPPEWEPGDYLVQVVICREWLDRHEMRWSINRKALGSYGLKHVVERWADTYIANGCFIAAAAGLGFKLEPTDPYGSPNALLNLSSKSVVLPEIHGVKVLADGFDDWRQR